ncbi:MAG TPA: HDOD domain-containing protein [Marinobacterium sp.]|nr:HDOD domain-containing protein [Marinobacterium sp.]
MTAELSQEPSLQVLLARQPIYTKNRDIVAYELLFRDDNGEFVAGLSEDETTVNVLLNTYSSVVGDKTERQVPFYLKVTDQFLLEHEIPELPRDRFVIEVIGTSHINELLVAALNNLARQGYRIALADYNPTDERFNPLLSIVHIVKLDVQKLGFEQLPQLVQTLRTKGVDLMADKVETDAEFRSCLEMGFEYFMGYFLSHPELVHGRKVRGNKLILMELLQAFDDPSADAKSIEALALKDPELTFKILRVVNSAAFSLKREVSSLSHAIALLGMEQVKRWVMLFLCTSDGEKPLELTRMMLQRGRMEEVLAELLERENPMNYFFVGLLSQLDALLGIPMPELLEQMPLDTKLKLALTDYAGDEGQLLRDVIHIERGEFKLVSSGLPEQFLQVAYRHSVEWANQIVRALA